MPTDTKTQRDIVRAPAEIRFAEELHALAENDQGPRPAGWRLSPRSVVTFVVGSDGAALQHAWQGAPTKTVISAKFYGDAALVQRCVVTLMGNRGLLLIGEPGTAKSMLSELLGAAISGVSTNTIQGSASTTEDQIKYSWNYARLLAEGPSLQALVPAPLYQGMTEGQVVRFEEITRCPPEIQDALISVLSDKILHVAELGEPDGVVLAARGFNVVATANTRDRGVHEMSSALKRRFNFETIRPIQDPKEELRLVSEQTKILLAEAQAAAAVDEDVIELLVTTFHELRTGQTVEGTAIERPSAVMSTAEAVSVSVAAGLDACYFDGGQLRGEHLVRQLLGTVLKDDPEDAKKLRHYFEVVVKGRARRSPAWKDFYEARRWLKG